MSELSIVSRSQGIPKTPFVQISLSEKPHVPGQTGGEFKKNYTYKLGAAPTYVTVEPNGKNDMWDSGNRATWVIPSTVKLKNGQKMMIMDHDMTNDQNGYYYKGTCEMALSGETITVSVRLWHDYTGGSGWYTPDLNVNFAVTGYF